MNKVISFSKKIILEMKEDRTTELAAEQAYYYMLSIFPMLILLLSIVPYLSIETKEAIDILQSVMPGETATIFKENVVQFISKPSGGIIVLMLWLFLTGLILVIGGEINAAYHRSKIFTVQNQAQDTSM
jgi:membrane protein